MDCLRSISRCCCFSNVASDSSADEAFLPLCGKKERSGRELSTPIFLLPSEALARQTQAPLQRGITGRDVWVSGRVTYFFFCSPLWSAGESCELRCWAHGFVTLSLLTAGARLLQVTAKWGVCARRRENVLYYACICLLSTDALQKCILGSMLNSFSLARRTAALNLVVMCMWGEMYRDVLASSS